MTDKSLSDRLLDHAAMHDDLSRFSDEQASFAADLREAAESVACLQWLADNMLKLSGWKDKGTYNLTYGTCESLMVESDREACQVEDLRAAILAAMKDAQP